MGIAFFLIYLTNKKTILTLKIGWQQKGLCFLAAKHFAERHVTATQLTDTQEDTAMDQHIWSFGWQLIVSVDQMSFGQKVFGQKT